MGDSEQLHGRGDRAGATSGQRTFARGCRPTAEALVLPALRPRRPTEPDQRHERQQWQEEAGQPAASGSPTDAPQRVEGAERRRAGAANTHRLRRAVPHIQRLAGRGGGCARQEERAGAAHARPHGQARQVRGQADAGRARAVVHAGENKEGRIWRRLRRWLRRRGRQQFRLLCVRAGGSAGRQRRRALNHGLEGILV